MTLVTQFREDRQGRRFADVLTDGRIDFDEVLEFLSTPERQRRMVESEVHHDRPPLAGVIRELESQSQVQAFFENNDGHTTMRFRQAVGVAVRLIMQDQGWRTTGRKGSLGKRVKVASRTVAPGAYHNEEGLARWFTRAERYELNERT